MKNMEIHKNLLDKYIEINKNIKTKLDLSTFAQIENCLKENKLNYLKLKKKYQEKNFYIILMIIQFILMIQMIYRN